MEWCARCGSLSQARLPGERDWQAPHRGLYVFPGTPAPINSYAMPIPSAPILSSAVMALVEANKGIFLDVGCSDHKSKGSVGMDKRAVTSVDIVHDIEVVPWPLPADCVSRMLMSHLIEHLNPSLMIDILNEAHRVMKPGGQLMIAMPYAGSPRFWQDPTHRHAWNEATCQYYDCNYPLWEVYRPQCWLVEQNFWDSVGDLHVIMSKRTEEHGQYHPTNGAQP
jgi:predicted SAM-dependent methyltransferase